MVVQEEKPAPFCMTGAIPKTLAAPTAKASFVPKVEKPPATPMREFTDQSFISSFRSLLRSNAPTVPVRLSKPKPATQDARQRSTNRDIPCESGSVAQEEVIQRNPEGLARSSRSAERFSSRKLFTPKIQHYDGQDDFKSSLVKIKPLAEAYNIFSKKKPEDQQRFRVSTKKLLLTF